MNPPLLLLVEDDPLLGATIEALLLEDGYLVETARHGQEAWDRLEAGLVPDLILSDIRMPNMNGYELLRAVRSRPVFETVPFIFLSAKAAMTDVRMGLALGADDYIPKPFDPEDALRSIRVRLERAARMRRLREQRGRFLMGYLPYEVRTPLTSILGYAELMVEMAEQGEALSAAETREFGGHLRSSGRRLHVLMENLNLWLELDARCGLPATQRPPTAPLTGWESAVVAAAQVVADRYGRRADLRVALAPAPLPLPDGFLPRVLAQLVDNAFRFSLPETPVTLVGYPEAGGYFIGVTDRGRGMKPDQIACIEAGGHFDRSRAEPQPVGVGLDICRLFAAFAGVRLILRSREEEDGMVVGFHLHGL